MVAIGTCGEHQCAARDGHFLMRQPTVGQRPVKGQCCVVTYPSGGGAAISGVNEVFAAIGAVRVGAHHALGDRHGITDRASGVEVAGSQGGRSTRGGSTRVADRDGAVEAALIGGLAAFGIPAAVGVPSVLLYRVLTCWLPVFVGWPVMRWLTENEMI